MPKRPPTFTPNQVVAFNLARARKLRGWTQEQAAEALAPYLGVVWSKANYSAAERSVATERVRQFTADDLVAFSQAFDLPVTWFLVPPAPPFGFPSDYRIATNGPESELTAGELIDRLTGPEVTDYVAEVVGQLPKGLRSRKQREQADAAVALFDQYVREALGDLSMWETSLRGLADRLGTAQTSAFERLRKGHDTKPKATAKRKAKR